MPDSDEFERLAHPYRRELLAHCYRMLGSVHDAEDLVQETYLRAWRAFDGFEGRSSVRTWLYRIATTACLTALERRGRRPMPSGLGGPNPAPDLAIASPSPEITWLQPFPDVLLGAETDPAAIAMQRSSLRLALIAAMQHLPPRQRAILILRDVLQWRAAEVADLLDTTGTAVNSALLRARAQVQSAAPVETELSEPVDADRRRVLDRYMAAFAEADMPALIGLLTTDATLEMPPFRAWFTGRRTIVRFLTARCAEHGPVRMVPVSANGEPAVAAYLPDGEGRLIAHSVQVLTVVEGLISRIDAFLDPELFDVFGLPRIRALVPR